MPLKNNRVSSLILIILLSGFIYYKVLNHVAYINFDPEKRFSFVRSHLKGDTYIVPVHQNSTGNQIFSLALLRASYVIYPEK